jgi:hypothetical protein
VTATAFNSLKRKKKMKTQLYRTLILARLLWCTMAAGQNETKTWCFGYHAGLDFSTAPPTIISGRTNNLEGCASISDAAGNLLFYSDGDTAWTKQHLVMGNGTGLFGDISTAQSALIVKQPGNANVYFLFTLDAIGGQNGLTYSKVDMNLAAGMGSITAKNIPVFPLPCTEKMSAVRHCNGYDVWVVVHEWGTTNYLSFLVTAAGVNTVAVISSVSTTQADQGKCMKFSSNGKKLGVVSYQAASICEVYDFNASTGQVSNPLTLLTTSVDVYGCEFSQDGTKFYTATSSAVNKNVFQWDLCAGTNSAIVASKASVGTSTVFYGSLQLAPNGKIYVARLGKTDLGVVNNPNLAGTACNYVDAGQSVLPKTSSLGLPNFVSSLLRPMPAVSVSSVMCNVISFSTQAGGATGTSVCTSAGGYTPTNISWEFGDPSSAASSTGSGSVVTHTFSAPGNYSVKCVFSYNCGTDTVKVPLQVSGSVPSLSVAGNLKICKGQKTVLTASGANSYTWSGNFTGSSVSITPSVATIYTVTGAGTPSNCLSSKIVSVTVDNCTGLFADQGNEEDFKLYPNPTAGKLNFVSSEACNLIVYDARGQIIYASERPVNKEVLHLTDDGIYLIQISSTSGSRTLRVVKSD